MDQTKFESEMSRARNFRKVERPDYWDGFTRGLRRQHHGVLYGTEQTHQLWMALANGGGDPASREQGLGYRDGLVT